MADSHHDLQRRGAQIGARIGGLVSPLFNTLIPASVLAFSVIASFLPAVLVLAIFHALKRVLWHALMVATPAHIRQVSGDVLAAHLRGELGVLTESEAILEALSIRHQALMTAVMTRPDGGLIMQQAGEITLKLLKEAAAAPS